MLKYIETPVVEIKTAALQAAGVQLLVKREDQNHPTVSGNKWWKLKYNLAEAQQTGHDTLLTFGGAFSNHLYATAAAAKELGLKSIGIVRGEAQSSLNSTLSFATACGMQIHYVSREAYRKKITADFVSKLRSDFGDFFLIPEGGTNAHAIRGCAEWAREKLWPVECTHICLPVGTGGTLAGIVSGLGGETPVIGFSVLKDGAFLREEIRSQLGLFMGSNWTIQTDYHFGGYAKKTQRLMDFIATMKADHRIPLDFVYTGKMLFGIFDLVQKGYFERGSVVMALHTGGLQGAPSED